MSSLKSRRFCFVSLLCVLFSFPVYATTYSGHATVEIVSNIVVSELTALSFEGIQPQSGKVTISPSGGRTTVNSAHNGGLATHAARFVATGTPSAGVGISFANGSRDGTGDAMDINNFTHDAGVTPAFDSTGGLDFHVGADVNLNKDQQSASYSGTYVITINYQ